MKRTLFILGGLALALCAFQEVPPDGPAPGESAAPSLSRLTEETASELIALAADKVEEGHFAFAEKVIHTVSVLIPDHPGLEPLEKLLVERRASFPPKHAPLDMTDHATDLFKGLDRKLYGWKPSRSKWGVKDQGLICESPDTDAFIYKSSGAMDERYSLSFRFQFPKDGKAGMVLGTEKSSKVGILFEQTSVALWDFKDMEPLGEPVKAKIKPNRRNDAKLEVRDGRITLTVTGVKGALVFNSAMRPARPGFYARGAAVFYELEVKPLEGDLLLKEAVRLVRGRKLREAASQLLRAREVDGSNTEVLALLGEVMAKLNYKGESLRCCRAFLALPGDPRDRAYVKSCEAALKNLDAAEAGEERLAGLVGGFVESVDHLVSSAITDNNLAEARTALEVVKGLGSHSHQVEDLMSRIYLAEQGGGEEVTLFHGDMLQEGKELAGWSKASGTWLPGEESAIQGGATLEGRAFLKSDPLPQFDRFLIRTRQRGTGSYIDQGIRLETEGQAYDFRLYKPMAGHKSLTGRKITVEKNGSPVFYKSMHEIGLTANEWYDVDLLVDINQVTLLFNGQALFTRVLPKPVKAGVTLFVETNRTGNFGAVSFKPLGNEQELRALLEEKGIQIRCIQECESAGPKVAKGAGRVVDQPFAFDGRSLRDGLTAESPLTFRFKSLEMEDAVFNLRYSTGEKSRADLKLFLDGKQCAQMLNLDSTGSPNDFHYSRMALGRLASGWHEVGLALEEGNKGIYLDRIEVTAPDRIPDTESRVYSSNSVEHFRIRLSPGMDLPDEAETIFTLLEVLRAFMVDYYGFEPPTPLYFNLISRDCWADPHKGGYATGTDLYIPDDITYSDLAVIMHEMSHCFDYRMGFNPPWFGEGKSFPCYDQFVEETGSTYRQYRSATALSDKKGGKSSFRQLDLKGVNLFQFWGTEQFPYWGKLPDGRNLTSMGYNAANWWCYELSKFMGPTWLKDYFALLRKEQDEKSFFMPRDRVYANSVIVDYFARSSGKDAAAFFEEAGCFQLRDIYDYESLVADCGEGDEDYLSAKEGVTVIDLPGSKNKARFMEKGELTYAFPVSPETKRLTLEVRKKGKGVCQAEGKVLFRGGSLTDRWETQTVKLKEPALWADSRLVLRFVVDGRIGTGLTIENIVLTP